MAGCQGSKHADRGINVGKSSVLHRRSGSYRGADPFNASVGGPLRRDTEFTTDLELPNWSNLPLLENGPRNRSKLRKRRAVDAFSS